jgi:hypothetical protein
MTSDQRKEVAIGLSLCVSLLALGAAVLFPVVVSGVDALRPRYYDPANSWYLTVAMFVAIMACFDISDRILRSKYLGSQAILFVYLMMFFYFVFRFLPLVLEYRVVGRFLIIVVVTSIASGSIIIATKHAFRIRRETLTS